MITAHEINDAYSQLARASETYFQAAELEIGSKTELDTETVKAIADGRIDGKNEAIRQGQAKELFAELHETHEANGQHARLAHHRLDLARLEVERIRALLRLAELAALPSRPA